MDKDDFEYRFASDLDITVDALHKLGLHAELSEYGDWEMVGDR